MSEVKKEELPKIHPIAFDCSGCYTTLNSVAEVINHHLETRHNVTLHCPCGKKFVKLKFLNAHIQKVHSYLLCCAYCSIKFEGVETFCTHKCTATRGKPFHDPIVQTCCPYCKILVDIGEPFDIHVKEHTKSSSYHCFKCERVFEHLNQRKSHFGKEHGTYPCRYCGKQLQLDDLTKHEAYHDGHGYPCHECRKAFTTNDALLKHKNIAHSALVQEIIKCPTCEKSMKLRFLRRHLSLHLHDELCQKCNKCFKYGQDVTLDDHVAKITCETCKLDFVSANVYEQHIHDGTCKKLNF